MYRLTTRYLDDVFVYICTFKIMHRLTNPMYVQNNVSYFTPSQLYASLIFAAISKPTTLAVKTQKTGMSKKLNLKRLKTYIFTVRYTSW